MGEELQGDHYSGKDVFQKVFTNNHSETNNADYYFQINPRDDDICKQI
jgi:hypothetical protein